MELRIQAFEIFKNSNGRATTKHIAEQLGIESSKVKYWRTKDKWSTRIKRGAPPGNQNAKGNKGGGAPKGSMNNLKHGNYCDASKFLDKGFLSKFIPTATKNIIRGIAEEGISTLDMLWDNIILCYSGIIRSQKIMHVKNQNDLTKELKRSKVKNKVRETERTSNSETEEELEYELQFAWDKQERFLKAQAAAMKTLNTMIKDYEELLHKEWDLATEEQKARIEVLKSKVVDNTDTKESKIDSYFEMLEEAINES